MFKALRFAAVCVVFLSFLVISKSSFSAPPAGQTAGGQTRQEEEIKTQTDLKNRIQTEKKTPQEATKEEIFADEKAEKVLVNKITVEGVTLLSQDVVNSVIFKFQGKELSLRAMQKVADLISDEYRKKGYITTRAFIPPQTIKDGVLLVKVIEGKIGDVTIKGNKYFKTSLLEKRLDLEKGGYFDYSALQNSLIYINEHPDRKASAVLVPGKAPGTTDIVVEVQDRLPVHLSVGYDNYGSRYIDKNRYYIGLEHNNFLGIDDKLSLKFQRSEADYYRLTQLNYLVSVDQTLDLGLFILNNKLKLGKEFEAVDARGTATIVSLFANKAVIREQNMDLRLTAGFDYKSVKNYTLGNRDSRDEVRMVKFGGDLDMSDKWGRTIFIPEIDFGIPNLMGGMESKYQYASRAGAGGDFTKVYSNLYRLQPMPFSTSLLWKNSAQYSNNVLVASEEFQIGGPTSVRGYPTAEFSGDRGYYTSLELSAPFYFLSKNVKAFFSQEKLYNDLKFVVFYDYGMVHTRDDAGKKDGMDSLKGYGFGARLNVSDNLTCRVEVGYPIGKMPSDGDRAHTWIDFSYKF